MSLADRVLDKIKAGQPLDGGSPSLWSGEAEMKAEPVGPQLAEPASLSTPSLPPTDVAVPSAPPPQEKLFTPPPAPGAAVSTPPSEWAAGPESPEDLGAPRWKTGQGALFSRPEVSEIPPVSSLVLRARVKQAQFALTPESIRARVLRGEPVERTLEEARLKVFGNQQPPQEEQRVVDAAAQLMHLSAERTYGADKKLWKMAGQIADQYRRTGSMFNADAATELLDLPSDQRQRALVYIAEQAGNDAAGMDITEKTGEAFIRATQSMGEALHGMLTEFSPSQYRKWQDKRLNELVDAKNEALDKIKTWQQANPSYSIGVRPGAELYHASGDPSELTALKNEFWKRDKAVQQQKSILDDVERSKLEADRLHRDIRAAVESSNALVGGNTFEQGMIDVAAMLPNFVVGGGATALNPSLGLAWWMGQITTGTLDDLRRSGVNIDNTTRTIALVGSLPEAAVENMQWATAMLPYKQAVKEVVKSRTKQFLKEWGKESAKQYFEENAEEVIQAFINATVRDIASSLQGKGVNWKQELDQIADMIQRNAVSMGMLIAPGRGIHGAVGLHEAATGTSVLERMREAHVEDLRKQGLSEQEIKLRMAELGKPIVSSDAAATMATIEASLGSPLSAQETADIEAAVAAKTPSTEAISAQTAAEATQVATTAEVAPAGQEQAPAGAPAAPEVRASVAPERAPVPELQTVPDYITLDKNELYDASVAAGIEVPKGELLSKSKRESAIARLYAQDITSNQAAPRNVQHYFAGLGERLAAGATVTADELRNAREVALKYGPGRSATLAARPREAAAVAAAGARPVSGVARFRSRGQLPNWQVLMRRAQYLSTHPDVPASEQAQYRAAAQKLAVDRNVDVQMQKAINERAFALPQTERQVRFAAAAVEATEELQKAGVPAAQMSAPDVTRIIRGVGTGEVQLLPAGTIPGSMRKVTDARSLAHLLAGMRDQAQETAIMVGTDSSGKVLIVLQHSMGGPASTEFHPAPALGALLANPEVRHVYWAHNHPSGDPTPSRDDRMINERTQNLLAGTPVGFGGGIVIGESQARLLGIGVADKIFKLKPDSGTRTIQLVTRQGLRNVKRLSDTRIQLASQAIDAFDQLGVPEGLLLVNQKHEPLSMVAMPAKSMTELRAGRSNLLLSEAHKVNAVAIFAKIQDVDNYAEATKNIRRFALASGLRVVDVVRRQEDGGIKSLAVDTDILTRPVDQVFYSATLSPDEHGAIASALARISVAHPNGPRVIVHADVEAALAAVPAAQRERFRNSAGIEGFFVSEGVIHLIQSNLSSAERVLEVWAHETGHNGAAIIDRLDPGSWARMMDEVIRLAGGRAGMLAKLGEFYAQVADDRIVAEEYLTKLIERGLNQETLTLNERSLLRKIIDWVRRLFGADKAEANEQALLRIAKAMFDVGAGLRALEFEAPEVNTAGGNIAVDQGRLLMSTRTLADTKKAVQKYNSKSQQFSAEQINRFFADLDNVANLILLNEDLQYVAAEGVSALKDNSAPQYKKSLDFTTMCIKRYIMQATVDAIQLKLNRPLTAEEYMDIRADLQSRGVNVSCGACYVDSRRIHIATVLNKAINGYQITSGPNKGKRVPPLKVPREMLLTMKGITEDMPKQFPAEYAKLRKMFAGTQMKIPEARTEYRGEILKLVQSQIDFMNTASGLRWQSWSDFELPHLLDGMQAIMDMAAKGLKGHAYTKVVDFVRSYAPTGLMINMSLIPKGSGFDAKGNLAWDETQSFPFDEAMKFRKKYDNVGTVAIAVSDEHLKALMADPRIDYILPYHKSGMSEIFRGLVGMAGWKDYEDEQSTTNADGGHLRPGQEDIYWSAHGTDLAEFDRLHKERGYRPRFERMRNWPGYEKLLTDRRIYGNDGREVVQQPVKFKFDMAALRDMLTKYKPTDYSAHQPTVDAMIAKLGSEPVVRASVSESAGLWDLGSIKQERTSAKTSINSAKLPATFGRLDKMGAVKKGDVIADIGGGKFDNAVQWAADRGATLHIVDPFNRTQEHNATAVAAVSGGQADVVTVNNVLNVISEPANRERVLRQAQDALRPGGKVYIAVYEGNMSGKGAASQGGESWQENRKLASYLTEVQSVFPGATIANGMIVAEKAAAGADARAFASRAYAGQKRAGELQLLAAPSVERKVITPKGTVVQRSKFGVGKDIGGKVYVHKDYAADVVPADLWVKALALKPSGFQFNTIVYDAAGQRVRFDSSKNFDTEREPSPGAFVWVQPSTGKVTEGKTDQIFHHKWLWVKDDYAGFDVQRSYDWSRRWSERISSPSGFRAGWERSLRQAGFEAEDTFEGFGSRNTVVTKEDIADAEKAWRESAPSAGSMLGGVNPQFIRMAVLKGMYVFEGVTREFEQWAAKMKAEVAGLTDEQARGIWDAMQDFRRRIISPSATKRLDAHADYRAVQAAAIERARGDARLQAAATRAEGRIKRTEEIGERRVKRTEERTQEQVDRARVQTLKGLPEAVEKTVEKAVGKALKQADKQFGEFLTDAAKAQERQQRMAAAELASTKARAERQRVRDVAVVGAAAVRQQERAVREEARQGEISQRAAVAEATVEAQRLKNQLDAEVMAFAKETLPEDEYKRLLDFYERTNDVRTPAEYVALGESIMKAASRLYQKQVLDDLRTSISEAEAADLRPEYTEKLKGLMEGITSQRPASEVVQAAGRTLMAALNDDVGEIPQRAINEATAIVERASGRYIGDLSVEDQQKLTQALRMIIAQSKLKQQLVVAGQVRDAQRVMGEAAVAAREQKPVSEVLDPTVRRLDKSGRPVQMGVGKRLAITDVMSHETKVDEMVGTSGAGHDVLFEAPQRAHDEHLRRNQDFEARLNSMLDAKTKAAGMKRSDLRGWSRDRTSVQLPEARGVDGKRITSLPMTLSEQMYLYASSMDPSTREELQSDTSGGITLQGARGGEAVILRNADLVALSEQMDKTPEGKLAKEIVDWFMQDSRENQVKPLNEAFRRQFGRDLISADKADQLYFPRKRDTREQEKEPNDLFSAFVAESSLKGLSFLKERTGGNAPIRIGDFFQTMLSSRNLENAFITKLEALQNAQRLLGNPEFVRAISERNKHADELIADLKDALKDWQGLESKQQMGALDRLWNWAINAANVGYLTANIPIILYQYGSIFNLLNEMSGKHVMAATKVLLGRGGQISEEMRQHSPTLYARAHDTGHLRLTPAAAGDRTPAIITGKKGVSDKLFAPIAYTDMRVVHVIWEAAKLEAKERGLEGDAFWQYVGQRARSVTERTQATWDALTSSTLSRQARQNPFKRTLLMFSSQTVKQFNMAVRAINQWRATSSPTAADTAAMVAKVGNSMLINSLMVYGIQQSVGWATSALAELALGPEDDNRKRRKRNEWLALLGQVAGGTHPFGSKMVEPLMIFLRKATGDQGMQGARPDPLSGALEGMYDTGKYAYDAIAQLSSSDVEKHARWSKSAEKAIRAFLERGAPILGLPTRGPSRILSPLWKKRLFSDDSLRSLYDVSSGVDNAATARATEYMKKDSRLKMRSNAEQQLRGLLERLGQMDQYEERRQRMARRMGW